MHYIHHPNHQPMYHPHPHTGGVVPLILLLFFSVILFAVFPVSDYTPVTHSVISDDRRAVPNYTVV